MKRLILPALFLCTFLPVLSAEAPAWAPDQAHSKVDLSVLHMKLSNVHGRFGNATGAVRFGPADVASSTVNITIDVSALDTGESARDAVLKSASALAVPGTKKRNRLG